MHPPLGLVLLNPLEGRVGNVARFLRPFASLSTHIMSQSKIMLLNIEDG